MAELLSRLQGALADRYRIEREIGAGGMATVYVAHGFRHDRKVALELMRPELSAVIGAERFLAEITLTANGAAGRRRGTGAGGDAGVVRQLNHARSSSSP